MTTIDADKIHQMALVLSGLENTIDFNVQSDSELRDNMISLMNILDDFKTSVLEDSEERRNHFKKRISGLITSDRRKAFISLQEYSQTNPTLVLSKWRTGIETFPDRNDIGLDLPFNQEEYRHIAAYDLMFNQLPLLFTTNHDNGICDFINLSVDGFQSVTGEFSVLLRGYLLKRDNAALERKIEPLTPCYFCHDIYNVEKTAFEFIFDVLSKLSDIANIEYSSYKNVKGSEGDVIIGQTRLPLSRISADTFASADDFSTEIFKCTEKELSGKINNNDKPMNDVLDVIYRSLYRTNSNVIDGYNHVTCYCAGDYGINVFPTCLANGDAMIHALTTVKDREFINDIYQSISKHLGAGKEFLKKVKPEDIKYIYCTTMMSPVGDLLIDPEVFGDSAMPVKAFATMQIVTDEKQHPHAFLFLINDPDEKDSLTLVRYLDPDKNQQQWVRYNLQRELSRELSTDPEYIGLDDGEYTEHLATALLDPKQLMDDPLYSKPYNYMDPIVYMINVVSDSFVAWLYEDDTLTDEEWTDYHEVRSNPDDNPKHLKLLEEFNIDGIKPC